MKLAVLNHGGRDPEQHFPEGPGAPSSDHPPVNFHAYAACTGGSFFQRDEAIGTGYDGALVLLRGNFKSARQTFVELRRKRIPVAISLKETGSAQIAETLGSASALKTFREICQRADGAIAATEDLALIYRAAGIRTVEFIPTPYPIEDPQWNFAVPIEERRGIFLGTREFKVPRRNHLAALLSIKPLAEAMGEPVTVVYQDGWRTSSILRELGYERGMLQVQPGRLAYPDYLRLLARHKIVFQLDASAVPGQVAGDCLLARVPCVGGNGAIERIAFPDFCGHGRSTEQLFDIAARMLEHPHDCVEIMDRALELAKPQISFAAVARQLDEFFHRFRR